MKKRVVNFLLVAIVAATAMSGCSSSEKSDTVTKDTQVMESQGEQKQDQESEAEAERPKREITYDLKDGVLTVSGDGAMEDYVEGTNDRYYSRTPWYNSREIKKIVIEDGITHIGSYAFISCNNLEEVVIADSVTSIGDSAFRYCENLSKINIPKTTTEIGSNILSQTKWMEEQEAKNTYVIINGYLMRSAKRDLTQIEIPKGVICIDTEAFVGFLEVEYVHIPGTVKTIRRGAFMDCKIQKMVIDEGVETLEESSITAKEVSIPQSVTYIGKGCSVPEGSKKEDFTIVNNIMVECHLNKNVKEVVIPEGVTYISSSAFAGFRRLEKVTIPDSVIGIGRVAFANCSNLKTVELGAGVKYIGERAFYNSGLTEIILNDGLETIDLQAFEGCEGLTSIIIPESVEYIEHGAFLECTNLTSVEMPEDVDYLGKDIFENTQVTQ